MLAGLPVSFLILDISVYSYFPCNFVFVVFYLTALQYYWWSYAYTRVLSSFYICFRLPLISVLRINILHSKTPRRQSNRKIVYQGSSQSVNVETWPTKQHGFHLHCVEISWTWYLARRVIWYFACFIS